jgi:hypothetical protein
MKVRIAKLPRQEPGFCATIYIRNQLRIPTPKDGYAQVVALILILHVRFSLI